MAKIKEELKKHRSPIIITLIAAVVFLLVYSFIQIFIEKKFQVQRALLSTLVFFLTFLILQILLNIKNKRK